MKELSKEWKVPKPPEIENETQAQNDSDETRVSRV
jgi:hypothetical protein